LSYTDYFLLNFYRSRLSATAPLRNASNEILPDGDIYIIP